MLRHFLSTQALELTQVEELFELSRRFLKVVKENRSLTLLQGVSVANLFFENSTRTRSSFEIAARRLGATSLNFSASTSSTNKGETLLDTAQNLLAMGPQAVVVRHVSAGSPWVLAQQVKVPVINAGDGFHEHPTQAMLDAFTIQSKLGSVKGKKILIVGDIAHSRVARSNIHLLRKLGASVTVCGPPTLLPPDPARLGVQATTHIEEALPHADVVMALRIQWERQNRMQIPSVQEYSTFWGINQARAKLLKRDAIIMHPGPVQRGVELDPEVADGSQSVILDQVHNGIGVRMAVLAWTIRPEETQKWLQS